jgi:hypothetical protein
MSVGCFVDRLESGVSLMKPRGNSFAWDAHEALIVPLKAYDDSTKDKCQGEVRKKTTGREVFGRTALLAGI